MIFSAIMNLPKAFAVILKFRHLIVGLACSLVWLLNRRMQHQFCPSSKLQRLSTHFLLKYLRSNHPKRLRYCWWTNGLLRNLSSVFFKRESKTDVQIHAVFAEHVIEGSIENSHLVAIGDSHVEFITRLFLKDNLPFFSNSSAIWLGARSSIGLVFEQEFTHYQNFLLEQLRAIALLSDRQNQKMTILWSMGTIDVRTVFYELKLRKVVTSDDQLFELFERAVNLIVSDFLFHFKNILRNEFSRLPINLCYSSCAPVLEKGAEPKTISELMELRKTAEFPVLGSFKVREAWRRKANQKIHSVCKKHNIRFHDCHLDHVDEGSRMLMLDSMHLTSPALIENCGRELLEEA